MALPDSRLPDSTTRRDWPDDLDFIAAHAVDLVHHVADDAGMVRNDADHFADLRPRLRAGEVEHAVLLGEIGDHRLRILDHPPEILDRVLLAGQHFRAGIDDG